MIKADYIRADRLHAEEICSLVHRTIRGIYPKYYPREAVEFFCGLHSAENISRDIADGQVYALIMNRKIIGTGSAKDNHITRVYVLPEFQRMGCGGKIMRELENLIAENHNLAYLDASLPAVCMYEHLGYTTIRHESVNLKNGAVLIYDIMNKKL